jgi:hypothetical protein
MSETHGTPPGDEPTRPSAARVYDYILGGTLNYPVDREVAEMLKAVVPDVVDGIWANRGFHGRAAVWMAEHGIRQFIDIESGPPTQGNTHQAVRKAVADARVVYIDRDPEVAAHRRPTLAGDPRLAVLTDDMRDPGTLLGHPSLRRLIDFAEPTGILMAGAVNFIADKEDPWSLVARYMAAVAPGSYLALSHGTADRFPSAWVQGALDTYAIADEPVYLRPKAEVERFFEGLELVPPYKGAGPVVTYAGVWGAEDPDAADTEGSRGIYCGVARRP